MAGNGVNWNISLTLEQLGGDESLTYEILDIFLAEAPKHLATLRLAVAEGTAETVEKAAHTLKGELGYLGIPQISKMAASMEDMGRSHDLTGVEGVLSQFEADLDALLGAVRSAVKK